MRFQICLIVWGLLTANIATAQQLEPFGLQDKTVKAMHFYGGSLYAATANDGVYRRYLGAPDSGWVWLGAPAKNLTSIFAFHTFCPLICWKGILVGNTFSTNPADEDSALLYFYQQRPDTCTKKGQWTAADSGIDRAQIKQINALGGVDLCQPIGPTYVTAFAAAMNSIWRSDDRGKSWKQAWRDPSTDIFAITAKLQSRFSYFNEDVWAGGYRINDNSIKVPLIMRSTDSGAHWEDRSPVTPSSDICLALALHPADTSIVYATLSHTIVKSRDAGKTWSFTQFSDIDVLFRALAINPQRPNHILAGGAVGDLPAHFRLYESRDAGEHWQAVIAEPAVGSVNSLVFDPVDSQYVYVATNRTGVYRYPRLKVAIDEDKKAPKQFQLFADFPNPFFLKGSASLMFRVNVPAADWLTIRLFNVVGQEIATWKMTLATGEQSIALPLDRAKLIAGIYFMQAEWRGQRVTRKWTVVR